jgi:class 3 adenylate cyclase/predicted ATPase/ABC-type transport system involved in cytochrome c biogenesis ATPase subunit
MPERRQLTLLFCDLADSTALSSRLDPEDLREVMARYYHVASETLRQHSGYIAKFLGDGLLVYFGWPTAHEDDAERAIRGGIATAEAVAQLNTSAGSLSVRVGIATGPVVVGDLLQAAGTQERSVIGETPNLAARLLSKAEPGAVVVDQTTRRLTATTFEWADLGVSELKGLPHPVRIWRVLCPAAVAHRFQALRSRRPIPLIGRDEELNLLLRCWHRAASGEGQVFLISGEPGIGKSRLIAALREAIAAAKQTRARLEWFCSPHHRDTALHPIITWLKHTAGFLSEDTTEAQLAKLETLFAATATTPENLSIIAGLLGMPAGRVHLRPDLSPQLRREYTLAALLKQVESLANMRPVLAVLEDAHWADPTTLELFDLLATRIDSLSLLLVATYRTEFRAPWTGQAHVTELRLSRLGRRDNAALVEQVAGSPGTLPPEVVADIVERTDGVPLFIEELAKAACEAGGLIMPPAPFSAPAAIPPTLYASLAARLDRLGATARQVAQAGAAIGREFRQDLLAVVAGLPDNVLELALRQLANAELIHRRGASPDATYSFRHVLLRDAAYGMLLRESRRAIHARIAEAIARLLPATAEREPQLLAWHYAGAGLADLAIAHWRRAAEQSTACFANREAIGHFDRALELVQTLPPGAKRDRLEADLRLAQIVPAIAVHGFGSQVVETCAARTKELGESLPDWPGRFAAHRAVWNSCLMRQPLPKTVALARGLLSLAKRTGDPARMALACRALGISLFTAGEQTEADAVFARGITLADNLGDTDFAIYGEDPRIICRIYRGDVQCFLGYPETGLRITEEGLARARARNNPHEIAWSLVVLAQLYTVLRDAMMADKVAAEAIDIARQHRFPQWLAFAHQRRGSALCQLGDPAQGLTLLEEGLRHLETTGTRLANTRAYCYLAEGCLLAGSPDAALTHLEAAHRHADTYGEHYLSAEIHRLHAEVLRVRGAPDMEIERHLRAARHIGCQQGTRLWELRAATSLARLWHTQGRATEAHGLLAPLYASFTEGFDLPDLIDARALLSGASRIQRPIHD